MDRFLSSSLTRMFVFSMAVFAGSLFLGLRMYESTGGTGEAGNMIEQLAQLMAPIGLLSPPLVMAVIFLNNSIKALVVIILGYSLGLVPFFFLVVNGLIIGLVVASFSGIVGSWTVVLALLPHGIIELPALLLAAALGFRVGAAVLNRILGREGRPGRELKHGLAVYAKVIVPALFIASAIETFVTPLIMGR